MSNEWDVSCIAAAARAMASQTGDRAFGRGSGDGEQEPQEEPPTWVLCKDEPSAEFNLDPELLSILCRRGRRRLRLLQLETGANIWIDRAAGLLHVGGSEAVLADVQRQLASLRGPRKAISPAVWAELMRTRTLSKDPGEGQVSRLQQESGCRIHIERDKHEVRIFGPEHDVAVCERMLEELGAECVEKHVPLPEEALSFLETPAMHAVAHACSVTLRVDKGQLAVLGMRPFVHKAVMELHRCIESWLQAAAASALDDDDDDYDEGYPDVASALLSTPWDTPWLQEPVPMKAPLPASLATPRPRPPAAPQAVVGSGQDAYVRAQQKGSRVQKEWRPERAPAARPGGCLESTACPTCGAGRFCIYCGEPTWRHAVPPGMIRNLGHAGAPCGFPTHHRGEAPQHLWGAPSQRGTGAELGRGRGPRAPSQRPEVPQRSRGADPRRRPAQDDTGPPGAPPWPLMHNWSI